MDLRTLLITAEHAGVTVDLSDGRLRICIATSAPAAAQPLARDLRARERELRQSLAADAIHEWSELLGEHVWVLKPRAIAQCLPPDMRLQRVEVPPGTVKWRTTAEREVARR